MMDGPSRRPATTSRRSRRSHPSPAHGVLMPRLVLTPMLLAALLAGLAGVTGRAEETPATAPSPDQIRFFEAKVRPTLVDHCFKCHGPTKPKAGLRLDSRAAMLAGGDSGPAVGPGNVEGSLPLTAISHEDSALKMPPSKKLGAGQVDDLTRWVKMGAPWPGGGEASASALAPRKGEFTISERDRNHWAFRPVVRPASPPVQDRSWATNPIDG